MAKRRKRQQHGRKKRKRLVWWLGLLLLLCLSPFYYGYVFRVASAAWYRISQPGGDTAYRVYEGFGIRMPVGHAIHGIDVSYYQGKIDWQRVAAMESDGVKISFAFIKATEGLLNTDPFFSRNWREAPKAGIKVGAYHFFRARQPGKWQARFFLQTVPMEKGDLPPVVDVERLDGVSPAELLKQLNAFLIHVESRTGVKPIIYTGLRFYRDYLKGYYKGYPLWIAHYHQPVLQLDRKSWTFWQHSDRGRVTGIGHRVDFNVFNGDTASFRQLLIR